MRAQVDHTVSLTLEGSDQPYKVRSDRQDEAVMLVRYVTGFARDQGKVSHVSLRGAWYRTNGELSYNQTEKRRVPVTELPVWVQLKIAELTTWAG